MGRTAAQARPGAGPVRRVDGRTPYGDGAGRGGGNAEGGYGLIGSGLIEEEKEVELVHLVMAEEEME